MADWGGGGERAYIRNLPKVPFEDVDGLWQHIISAHSMDFLDPLLIFLTVMVPDFIDCI